MKLLRIVVIYAASALLTGCGGGGGGGEAAYTGPSPTLNLQSAWDAYKQQTGTFSNSMSGTSDGISLSGTGNLIIGYQSPDSLAIHDVSNPWLGRTVVLSNMSRTLMELVSNYALNGVTTSSSSENWYYDNTGVLKVIWNVDENEQAIVSSASALPTAVTVGSAGSIYNATVYSRLGYTCGTRRAVFSVTALSATALTVTITDTETTTRQTIGQCSTTTLVNKFVYQLSATGLIPKSLLITDTASSTNVTYTF